MSTISFSLVRSDLKNIALSLCDGAILSAYLFVDLRLLAGGSFLCFLFGEYTSAVILPIQSVLL